MSASVDGCGALNRAALTPRRAGSSLGEKVSHHPLGGKKKKSKNPELKAVCVPNFQSPSLPGLRRGAGCGRQFSKLCGAPEKFEERSAQDGNRSGAQDGLLLPLAKKKEKVEPAFLPDKTQQHNKNPEEGGMSDVTEPSSQADKGGARGWRAGRGGAKRADSKLFLFKKKKVVRCSEWFLSPLPTPRLLSSSPFPLLPFESFFFFSSPSLTAWLIQLKCQSTFFSSSSSFKYV